MTDKTKIEWTDATWNPVTGCTKVSPGCDHCYAETFAERFRGTPGHYFEHGFDVQLRPDKLEQPLRWRRPRRIFVNSMSDLFHDEIPEEYIARVFAVMALAPQHTFQVLTKRHGRMRSLLKTQKYTQGPSGWLSFEDVVRNIAFNERNRLKLGGVPNPDDLPWPLPNVWLGVSVENQQWADIRVPALLDTPAEVRFLSCEPLLGSVDLDQPRCDDHGRRDLFHDDRGFERCSPCAGDGFSGELSYGHWLNPLNGGINWVIVGGESGRGARPMHPDWARSLRDQCQAAGVAFHFKQWGEYAPVDRRDAQHGDVWVLGEGGMSPVPWRPDTEGAQAHRWGPHMDHLMRRIGKKAAGRELDRRTWNEFPRVGV